MAGSLPVTIASDQSSVAVTAGAPPSASVVAGAAAGTAAAAAADITGATVAAGKVFQGSVVLSLSASQAAAANAAGTSKLQVSWVPGTSGTGAQVVGSVDLDFSASGATGGSQSLAQSVAVPVTVYAGTTSGKFQVACIESGTITHRTWDVSLTGTAQ